MSEADRFWCHEARNVRCVRKADYDALAADNQRLRSSLQVAVDMTEDGTILATERNRQKLIDALTQWNAAMAGSKEGE